MDAAAQRGGDGRTPRDGERVLEGGGDRVVTSNGALNLVPDKPAVLREIYRVLRGGGRFQFADVVRVQAPSDEQGDPDAWSS